MGAAVVFSEYWVSSAILSSLSSPRSLTGPTSSFFRLKLSRGKLERGPSPVEVFFRLETDLPQESSAL